MVRYVFNERLMRQEQVPLMFSQKFPLNDLCFRRYLLMRERSIVLGHRAI